MKVVKKPLIRECFKDLAHGFISLKAFFVSFELFLNVIKPNKFLRGFDNVSRGIQVNLTPSQRGSKTIPWK